VADPDLADVRTLVLTTFDDDEYVYGALRAGAAGFLLKDADPQTLVDAVHRVRAGDSLLDPAVTGRIISTYVELARHAPLPGADAATGDAPAGLDAATPREREGPRAVARRPAHRGVGAGPARTGGTVERPAR